MKLKLQRKFTEYGVSGIAFDSTKVKAGDAFFAIKGQVHDGNDYIDSALSSGALVAFSDDLKRKTDRVVYVENAREAMAIAAEVLYPNLSSNIVAVTGTNGKSSVVSYVHQILDLLGKSSAAIGTLGVESNQSLPAEIASVKSNLTTSDVISLRRNLHLLANSGVDYVTFEASSHGIQQKRLGGLKVKGAAFVSFSQDHLDYHKTMDNYLHAKLKLFADHLLPGAGVVINSEIAYFDVISKFLKAKGIDFATVGKAGDIKIVRCDQSLGFQEIFFEFRGNQYSFKTDIIGSFQATNILIAVKLVHNLGIAVGEVLRVLPKIHAVSGRLQRITSVEKDFQVFVDYAHTPDALEKSLEELRSLKRKNGNLYVLFGCGGDRDSKKRPIMGEVATKIADHVIITDDNPRTEDAGEIRRQILAGANKGVEIGDRKQAITDTIARLKKDDILLIAGKGHEDYQIIDDRVIDFSDIEIAKMCCK